MSQVKTNPVPLSSYICTLFATAINKNADYEPVGDCTASFYESNGKHYLSLKSDPKNTIIKQPFDYSNIVKNIELDHISANNNNYQTVLIFQAQTGNTRFGLNFDANSAAASKKFRDDFMKYKYTTYQSLYFRNGLTPSHIKYAGEMLNNEPHGTGILFYNNKTNSVMCEGNFTNGKYDGVNTFYDPYGVIVFTANNVSKGKFKDFGTLKFGGKSFEIDTEDPKYQPAIPPFLDVGVASSICVDLCRIAIEKFDSPYSLMAFKRFDDNEKIEFLLQEIGKLKLENAEIREEMNKIKQTIRSPISLGSSLFGLQ